MLYLHRAIYFIFSILLLILDRRRTDTEIGWKKWKIGSIFLSVGSGWARRVKSGGENFRVSPPLSSVLFNPPLFPRFFPLLERSLPRQRRCEIRLRRKNRIRKLFSPSVSQGAFLSLISSFPLFLLLPPERSIIQLEKVYQKSKYWIFSSIRIQTIKF